MSFTRYDSYRPSGADWLGNIPEHWSAARIKTLFEIRKRIAGELGHDVLSVTQRGLKVRDIDSNAGQLSMDYSKYQLVERDDFVMNHMDLLTGYIDLSRFRGVTSPDYRVFAMRRNDIALKFFLYLFQNGYHRRIFYAFGQGASGLGRWRMPTDSFNDFILPVPPLVEQLAITRFLDRETKKIDALVEEQQRLIDLLREKRQAVISHAISNGLDPNVPMKDSGIDWLGRVPEHWEVIRIKWVAQMESGHTPDKKVAAYWTDCTIPWVSLHDTGFLKDNDHISETAQNVNELGIANSSARLLPTGAVVFSRDATIGRCGITTRPMAVSQHFIAWICGSRVQPDYLLQVLRSMSQELDRLTFGATVKTIGMPDVRKLVMPLPPVHEQIQIVAYLTQALRRFDALLMESGAAIALLQERRAALISAAVSGKIDVRGLVETDVPVPDVVAA